MEVVWIVVNGIVDEKLRKRHLQMFEVLELPDTRKPTRLCREEHKFLERLPGIL